MPKLTILTPTTNDHTVQGLLAALAVAGHNCIFLNNNKAIYDAFYEIKPDIFICYVNDYIKASDPIAEFKTPTIVLKSKINEEHVKGLTVKPAVNLAQYGKQEKLGRCGMSYLNLNEPNEVLLNFLEDNMCPNRKEWYLRIFGKKLPYFCYLGEVSIKETCHILSSSEVILNLYNDFVLEAAWHGALSIPFRSNPLLIPEEIFGRAESVPEIYEQLKKDYTIDKKIEWMLNGNTYYDRAGEVLSLLNYKQESEECYLISKDQKR